MSLKDEDDAKTEDVKLLDFVNGSVREKDVELCEACSLLVQYEKSAFAKPVPKPDAFPGNEDPPKVLLDDGHNCTPKSEDAKPRDSSVKWEAINVIEALYKSAIEFTGEDNKLLDIAEHVKHEASCKYEERSKLELEDGNGASMLEAMAQIDGYERAVDAQQGIFKCEDEKKAKMECINEKSDDGMKLDNVNVTSTGVVCQCDERAKPELEYGYKGSILATTAEIDDQEITVDVKQGTIKYEDEKKPKMETITEESGDGMQCDNIDATFIDTVLPSDDTAELSTPHDNVLDRAPPLQDGTEFEDEKKPKVESVTEGPNVEMQQTDIGMLSAPDVLSQEELREPSALVGVRLESIPLLQEDMEMDHEPVHTDEPEVIILKDEPQEADAIEFVSSDDGRKRRRLVVEVVLYTREALKQLKQEDYEKIKKLANPKAQKVEKMDISIVSVYDRLKPIGLDPRPITLDKSLQETIVSRAFMSSVYGGNMQVTFPKVSAKHFAIHGIDDFMYVNTMFQPRAPQIPGYPGLFFDTEADNRFPGTWRLFTRLKSGEWFHVGFYIVRPSPSLSKEEWAMLDPPVKRTWAYQICKKSWAGYFCARVIARKELGRKPTKAEWMAVFQSGRHKNATPDDIRNALDKGDEKLAVSTMKCVGYDEAFQLQLCEKWSRWTPPERKKREKQGTRSAAKTKTKPVAQSSVPATAGRKRKPADSVEPELTESEDEEEEDEEVVVEEAERNTRQNEVIEILDDDDEVQELTYRPRGTRSRPIFL